MAMTYEELKARLKKFRDTKRRMKQLEAQIAEARASIDGVGAFRFDSVAVCGGQMSPVQVRYVEHMERLLSVYGKLLAEVEEDVKFLEEFLSVRMGRLTPFEQSLITERYISGKSWRTIRAENHYEEVSLYKIMQKAIKKLLES